MIYQEGFYAVNGGRVVVDTGLTMECPDTTVVEVFKTLKELDAKYPEDKPTIDNTILQPTRAL